MSPPAIDAERVELRVPGVQNSRRFITASIPWRHQKTRDDAPTYNRTSSCSGGRFCGIDFLRFEHHTRTYQCIQTHKVSSGERSRAAASGAQSAKSVVTFGTPLKPVHPRPAIRRSSISRPRARITTRFLLVGQSPIIRMPREAAGVRWSRRPHHGAVADMGRVHSGGRHARAFPSMRGGGVHSKLCY